METSIFYRLFRYMMRIQQYSFFYRNKDNGNKKKRYTSTRRIPIYKHSLVYRMLQWIGKGCKKVAVGLHHACSESRIIGLFATAMNAMKKTKVWACNQLLISIIIGYGVTNGILGVFTTQKIMYLAVFLCLLLGVNLWAVLYKRCSKNSLIVRMYYYMIKD